MRRLVQLSGTSLTVIVLALAGCSDADDEPDAGAQSSGASGSTEVAEAGTSLDRYCELVSDYDAATRFAPTDSVDELLLQFEDAAAVARSVVGVAPAEVQDQYDRIADGGELLVERLRAAEPESIDELALLSDELASELEDNVGDLDAAVELVLEHASSECGLEFGEPAP